MRYVAAVNALQKEIGLKLYMIMHEWMCLRPCLARAIWLNADGERKRSDTS